MITKITKVHIVPTVVFEEDDGTVVAEAEGAPIKVMAKQFGLLSRIVEQLGKSVSPQQMADVLMKATINLE